MSFQPLVYKGESKTNSFVAGYLNSALNNSNYDHYEATQCTGGACGRAKNCGFGDAYASLGNARQGADYYSGTKIYTGSYSAVEPGDVIVFGLSSDRINPGHVVFVESVNGHTMTISEAADSTHHPDGLQVKDITNGSGTAHGDGSGVEGGEGFVCICKSPGNGAGGELIPDVPPDGKPDEGGDDEESGHYETRTYSLDYSTEYECGTGLVSGQTGSQDTPLAPVQMDGNPDGTRKNERGEPFNMYTYERTLTYDKDNNPVGSNGELKYSGSQTLTLGEQPSYGNGGEMDGGDE